ncbi:hypothetical protein F4780DRAFT_783870 [Xylariomycetidae sp. FL0641]|nr:hypothetical protein F4780DRAFT_783870 [Xylariomycetidae sp. FL0641]
MSGPPHQGPPELPRSPYAVRYGIHGPEGLLRGITHDHSGFRPLRPEPPHEKYYGTLPEWQLPAGPDEELAWWMPKDVEIQDDDELDKLMFLESWQMLKLYGIRTWQCGALNRFVTFRDGERMMSGGHLTEDADRKTEYAHFWLHSPDRIQVDENSWFTCFKKSHWYDLDDGYDPRISGNWSVDNPIVWENISVSIELANRILRLLIRERHPWIVAIICGRMDLWKNWTSPENCPDPDAHVLLPLETEARICQEKGREIEFPERFKYTEAELTEKLDQLGRPVFWSFAKGGTDVNGEEPIWGGRTDLWAGPVTDLDYDGNPGGAKAGGASRLDVFVMTKMNADYWETLMRDDLTMAERCRTTVWLANLFLHELMHGLVVSRYHNMQLRYLFETQVTREVIKFQRGEVVYANFPAPAPNSPFGGLAEPFYNFEAVSEVGDSFTNSVWGGRMMPVPTFKAPLTQVFSEWPSFDAPSNGQPKIYHSLQMKENYHTTLIHPFATWASRLLSTEFWNLVWAQAPDGRDLQRLRPNNPFIGSALRREDRMKHGTDGLVVNEGNLGLCKAGTLEEQANVAAWEEKTAQMDPYRQRYLTAAERWTRSAWGLTEMRGFMRWYRRAFAQGKVRQCAWASNLLRRIIPRDVSGDAYWALLPNRQNREDYSWLLVIIGLLMAAAIPVQESTQMAIVSSISQVARPSASARWGGSRVEVSTLYLQRDKY